MVQYTTPRSESSPPFLCSGGSIQPGEVEWETPRVATRAQVKGTGCELRYIQPDGRVGTHTRTACAPDCRLWLQILLPQSIGSSSFSLLAARPANATAITVLCCRVMWVGGWKGARRGR